MEAAAERAFKAFEETGDAFDPPTAKTLAENIYAAGGRQDPAEAYIAFRSGEQRVSLTYVLASLHARLAGASRPLLHQPDPKPTAARALLHDQWPQQERPTPTADLNGRKLHSAA